MNNKTKTTILDILCEIAGNFLISFATYNIAASAEFAVSGFSGIAVILFRLFNIPMGTTIFVLNIPLALLCAKILGFKFLAKSVRCIAIQSLMMNYLVPLLPTLSVDRMIAALVVGICYGVSFAFIYMRGSSTGGLDFIIMLLKHKFPHMKTGTISFVLDFITLLAAGLVFKDFEAVVYGIIIVFVSASTIDRIVLGFNSGAMAYIVTESGKGQDICNKIDKLCERGSTLLEGTGGYSGEKKDVVMVVGSYRDIYKVQSFLKNSDPDAFIIILDSKEVQGEGFQIRRAGAEE